MRDAIALHRGEAQRDSAAQVHADDVGARHSQRREGTIHVFGLCRDPKIGVERAVRLAIAQQIERDGGVSGSGNLGCDVAPEEARRAEPMQKQDRQSPVSVALDMDRAWTDRDAKQIRLDRDLDK